MEKETEKPGGRVSPVGGELMVKVTDRSMVGAGVRPGDSLPVAVTEFQGETVEGRLYALRVRSGGDERVLIRLLGRDEDDGTLWALAHGEGGIDYTRLGKLGDAVTVLGYVTGRLRMLG